jgi:hypothetical protein
VLLRVDDEHGAWYDVHVEVELAPQATGSPP